MPHLHLHIPTSLLSTLYMASELSQTQPNPPAKPPQASQPQPQPPLQPSLPPSDPTPAPKRHRRPSCRLADLGFYDPLPPSNFPWQPHPIPNPNLHPIPNPHPPPNPNPNPNPNLHPNPPPNPNPNPNPNPKSFKSRPLPIPNPNPNPTPTKFPKRIHNPPRKPRPILPPPPSHRYPPPYLLPMTHNHAFKNLDPQGSDNDSDSDHDSSDDVARVLPSAANPARVPDSGNKGGLRLDEGMRNWLVGLGLGRYAPVFEIHEVDEEVLPLLTLDDLKDMGITAVGTRRKLYFSIQKLPKSALS